MLRILVVEDDDATREAISDALAAVGHEVTNAADGVVALQATERGTFDLVVCDVHLPRVDGLTVLLRVRAAAPSTSFVLMTALAEVADVVRAIGAGADEFVTKPFDVDEFARTTVARIADRVSQNRAG